jgi:hypothetical protein
MSKLLFASYSHVNRDKYLDDFVKELANEVLVHLQGMTMDDVVFFDANRIETGEYWRDRLAEELTGCRACVAICTPAFVASEFCGKELRVFLSRLAIWEKAPLSQGITQRPVFPVLWVKVDKELPAVLGPFQHKKGEFAEVYSEKGLRVMYRLDKYAQDRTEIVLSLAERIAAATKLVALPADVGIPHFDQIVSAFQLEEAPVRHGMAIVPLLQGGLHGEPYPGSAALSTLIRNACGAVPWRVVQQDAELGDRLRIAREAREISLVVTDLETLGNPVYQPVIHALGATLAAPAAVIVRRAAAPESELMEQHAALTVQTAFRQAMNRGVLVDWTSSRSARALEAFMARTILNLRAALIGELEPLAAKDTQLSAEAASEGIPIDTLATVATPGGAP